MQIKTPRLCLVPLSMRHLESTYHYASDPENTRYMVFLPVADVDEARAFILGAEGEWLKLEPQFYEMAILRDGEHIGGINLTRMEAPDAAELGWILRKDCWGRGYATEAARAMVVHAARQLGIRRFIAHCDAGNAASAAVMRKLGMRLTGRSGGRKNRASDEAREELTFEMTL